MSEQPIVHSLPSPAARQTAVREQPRVWRMASFVRAVKRWIEDRRYLAQQKRLADDIKRSGQLEVLLEALNVTREQFDCATVPPLVAAELSQRMLKQVDARGGIGADELAAVQVRCRSCHTPNVCRRWLDRKLSDSEYEKFCANAALLDMVRMRMYSNKPSLSQETDRS